MCTRSSPGPTRFTLLATAGDDSTVRLWDPTTGDQVGPPLRGHLRGVLAVFPLPDGRTVLAVGGDGPNAAVRLWDPTSGTPINRIWTGGLSAACHVPGRDGAILAGHR